MAVVPFFMKLDIQSHELKALRGGEETIRAPEPILLTEGSGPKIADYVTGLGYRPNAYRRGKFIPGVSGDLSTLFMTERRTLLVRDCLG
ncbi:MAG TPA: hypothetical protein VN317_01250 [Candidatus Methanoperedens sp.]|nr:hypothetical protein [Candidatus Methanoperedens sp.]